MLCGWHTRSDIPTHQCANNRAQPRRYRYPRPDRARKFPHIKKRASGRALGRALAYQDKTRRGLRGEEGDQKQKPLLATKNFFASLPEQYRRLLARAQES